MANTETEQIYAAITPKIFAVIILPLTSTVTGLLPVHLGKRFYHPDENGDKFTMFDKLLAFFLYFGGGVLLCTIFLHLLPEIHEDVEKLAEKGIYLNKFVLSYPELILCGGFFLMFAIEEIMHTYFIFSSSSSESSIVEVTGEVDRVVFVVERPGSSNKVREDDGNNSGSEQEHINPMFDGNKNYHSCANQHCQATEHMDKNYQSQHSRSTNNQEHSNVHHHSHHNHSHLPDTSKSVFYGLLTVVALSTHEFFEGLAIGLAPKASDVWYLLIAVCCHKVVLAGFIGVQMLITRVSTLISSVYVIAFSCASPLGIIGGAVLSSTDPVNNTLSVVALTLQAIACGTLLYIVFFEVYSKQFGSYQLPGIMKLLSSVVGFMVMALLQIKLST